MGSDTLTDKAPFEQFAEKAKRAVGWRFYELDGSHSPMELLERILQKIGRDRFGLCGGDSSIRASAAAAASSHRD